jgi:hypothetical protein
MEFASVALSLSLSQSRRQIASATRNGIRVCKRSLSRWGSSCVVGDETWNPRLSLTQSRRYVSSATRQGIRVSPLCRRRLRVFAACEVLTLRFLPCCVPVAWSSLDDE